MHSKWGGGCLEGPECRLNPCLQSQCKWNGDLDISENNEEALSSRVTRKIILPSPKRESNPWPSRYITVERSNDRGMKRWSSLFFHKFPMLNLPFYIKTERVTFVLT